MFVVVDNYAVAFLQPLLGGHLGGNNQQVSYELGMLWGGLAEPREALAVLWNDKEVHGGDRVDVLEGERLKRVS